VHYFNETALNAIYEEVWFEQDYLFGNDFRVTLGFLLNIPFNNWGREGNVGTAGAGGYCGFADPENRLSFGYTPNRFTSGEGLGDEQGLLVKALYECPILMGSE